MQLKHKAFHLAVFGGSGMGKTEYALRFVATAGFDYNFLFDAEGEFAERMHLLPCRTVYEIDQAIKTGWVCYDPHTMYEGEVEKGLAFFCKYALEASKRLHGRKSITIDELGRYTTGSSVPKPLKIIAQAGRRCGLDGVFMGQQPNELHNTIRSQLTEVVCFQLTDDCALEFPKKFGFDVEAVRTLRPYQFIARTRQGSQYCAP